MIIAISFDVWNTLLKIDVMFRRLAKTLSITKGLDPVEVERRIYETYRKAKELRLYINDSNEVRSYPGRTRQFLAKALGIEIDEIVNAIETTFSLVDKDTILYSDVVSTLDALNDLDIKMGVIGNTVFWESIYTRELLEGLNLRGYFKVQLYSDEVGVFKPDRRIFLEFCRRINAKPHEVIHVGDSVIEDIGGAISTGMKALLIDRNSKKTVIPLIGIMISPNLSDVIEAIQIFSQQ